MQFTKMIHNYGQYCKSGKVTHVLRTNLHVFDPLSLKKVCICGNEATIDYHHGSALQSGKTYCCSL